MEKIAITLIICVSLVTCVVIVAGDYVSVKTYDSFLETRKAINNVPSPNPDNNKGIN